MAEWKGTGLEEDLGSVGWIILQKTAIVMAGASWRLHTQPLTVLEDMHTAVAACLGVTLAASSTRFACLINCANLSLSPYIQFT